MTTEQSEKQPVRPYSAPLAAAVTSSGAREVAGVLEPGASTLAEIALVVLAIGGILHREEFRRAFRRLSPK